MTGGANPKRREIQCLMYAGFFILNTHFTIKCSSMIEMGILKTLLELSNSRSASQNSTSNSNSQSLTLSRPLPVSKAARTSCPASALHCTALLLDGKVHCLFPDQNI